MPRYSPLASPAATIAALQHWGLYTKKSLGQHFLIDDGVIGKILRLADVSPGASVLEVGPGIGTLTEALLGQTDAAEVVSVEVDERLDGLLADISVRSPGRFRYIIKDALQLGIEELPTQFDLVANLPYSVAATIILDAFQRFSGLRSATVMVQREVAQRIMAVPGTKAYGAYTVKLAMLASVAGSFAVARSSFLPPPRVDSTVVKLLRTIDSASDNYVFACRIIDAAFAERRKTLRNSLRSTLGGTDISASEIDVALESSVIDGQRRAESLSLEEFNQLVSGFGSHS